MDLTKSIILNEFPLIKKQTSNKSGKVEPPTRQCKHSTFFLYRLAALFIASNAIQIYLHCLNSLMANGTEYDEIWTEKTMIEFFINPQ